MQLFFIGIKYNGLPYDERLKMLNLENLQARRTRFDLIMCYKIIFGLVCVNADDFLVSCKQHSWLFLQVVSAVL